MNDSNKISKGNKKSTFTAMALTILIFAGLSSYLFYDNFSFSKKNTEQGKRIDSLTMLTASVQNEMVRIKEELNSHKGKNKELENAINKANEELTVKEQKIRKLISNNASLQRIQKEVIELRMFKDKHLKKIHDLEEQIALLTKQNGDLKDQNNELLNRLRQLEDRNVGLEKKVQIASIIKTENAIIIGEKKHKNEKYAPTKLKKAERLLITFDLDENKVADAGEKTFYIRVLNPSGKLIENQQSGSFTNSDNNMSMPYTSTNKVNYSNAKQKVIIPVDLNGNDHPKGIYNIEFYCNGYLSGVKKLHVR